MTAERTIDWEDFLSQRFEALYGHALRRCRQLGLSQDLAEDVLQFALVKVWPRRIEGGEEGLHRFMNTVINNRCIDLIRDQDNRTVQPPDTGTGTLPWLATLQQAPPTNLDARRQARALELGTSLLPLILGPSCQAMLLAAVQIRILGEQPADYAHTTEQAGATVRQNAHRGALILAGWVHALCGGRPASPGWGESQLRYWRRGFSAGLKHLKEGTHHVR